VSEASDMLFRTLGATIRIETELADGLWPALADPTQLDLVMLNLVINARDAMPGGGLITIRTSNAPPEAVPAELPPSDYVMVSVTDTGTGMSEEVLAKAVDPFFTTKPVGSGSGLGLSMVQGVASQSGGGIRIDSRVGQGTTVSVFLPRALDHQPERAVPKSRPSLDHTRAKILVVDDDAAVRDLTVHCLRNMGHEALVAEDGVTALTMLSTGPVDLLVADLAMPGINGPELIRRAREQWPGLRALLMTGFANMAALGARIEDPVLQKPFRIESLSESIAAALADPTGNAGHDVVGMRPGNRGP
jgi:CheY-like chemotaxis protein